MPPRRHDPLRSRLAAGIWTALSAGLSFALAYALVIDLRRGAGVLAACCLVTLGLTTWAAHRYRGHALSTALPSEPRHPRRVAASEARRRSA